MLDMHLFRQKLVEVIDNETQPDTVVPPADTELSSRFAWLTRVQPHQLASAVDPRGWAGWGETLNYESI